MSTLYWDYALAHSSQPWSPGLEAKVSPKVGPCSDLEMASAAAKDDGHATKAIDLAAHRNDEAVFAHQRDGKIGARLVKEVENIESFYTRPQSLRYLRAIGVPPFAKHTRTPRSQGAS